MKRLIALAVFVVAVVGVGVTYQPKEAEAFGCAYCAYFGNGCCKTTFSEGSEACFAWFRPGDERCVICAEYGDACGL